jgi:hypothetical protein
VITGRSSRASSTNCALESPGATCRPRSGHGRRRGSGTTGSWIDRTWDTIHARLLAEADVAGDVDSKVSVDYTINSADQHATTLSRVEESAGRRIKRPQEVESNTRICAPVCAKGHLTIRWAALAEGRRSARRRPRQTAGDRVTHGRPATPRCSSRCSPGYGPLGPRSPQEPPRGGDRRLGHSSRAIRADLRSRGISAVIPQPSTRSPTASAAGRPAARAGVRGRDLRGTQRHRAILQRPQQWRGLATRYDKLAAVYRGGVVLRAITIWLTT